MEEIWKDVPGYEGLYRVSNMGRVKRVASDRILLYDCSDKRGYLRVTLCKYGKTKRHLVHRLVAFAFIPNPYGYRCVNHLDENPLNNCVENLEWCSHKINNNYGGHNKKISESLFKSKKLKRSAVKQYTLQGEFIRMYKSMLEATVVCGGKSCSNIKRCCDNKYKQAYGYIWRYD